MSGLCGWIGGAADNADAVIARMCERFAWHRDGARAVRIGTRSALAAIGPRGTATIVDAGSRWIALHGHPIWRGKRAQGAAGLDALALAVGEAFNARPGDCLADLAGDFALAIVDDREGRALLAIDRIGVRNVVYQQIGSTLVFGASADVVAAHPRAQASVDPQALYDYVYFHMVPGPATIYRERARLSPAHCLQFDNGRATVRRYWTLGFVENARGSVADFKPAFRAALTEGVAAFADHERCGTFLSGGTDSSTVSGLLGAVTGKPAQTYSIGFDATGYDEMAYARIAARHFATEHHEYYVTPDDVVRAVPLIAAAYDQPFGNASAVPTFYCAKRAADDGVARMLGGDGGDELFGGNDRYARQYRLALYERAPAAARALLAAALFALPGAARMPLLRRARSYVEQARLPMPARYESYNLLQRLGPDQVFRAEFLAQVDRAHPLDRLTHAYRATNAQSLINRMLALDIEFTLADNDLPKVTRMCDIAGVDVAFPMLHDAVVEFSTTLPPRFKLRGTTLRYFFKQALRDFLPHETIAKAKHGFGLPTGVWLRDVPRLRELAGDAIAGLRRRSIFRDELLDELLTRRLSEHAGYYGTLAWVLMMLEMWFRAHPDAAANPGASAASMSLGRVDHTRRDAAA